MMEWYRLSNIDEVDSPCLVLYKERIEANIVSLIQSIDDIDRLRPHVKTHKSSRVGSMMLKAGINKFKCATIAEAEMLASCGATDILLAYQPVGPKVQRFLELNTTFPTTTFSCLVDNLEAATAISSVFLPNGKKARVWIDLNVGMNRTGILPGDAFGLARRIQSLNGLELNGLHAYDGHIRDEDFQSRLEKSNTAFTEVEELQRRITVELGVDLTIVAGGTPTYSVHSKRKNVECSPGTFIYWDKGYERILREQQYLHAALVITRVISKPGADLICVDLGHKSIAAENPLPNRVEFLNAPGLKPVGQSEEHLVLESTNAGEYNVGDILYGVPYHVCPTIALYEKAAVADAGRVVEWWTNVARDRKINI